AAVPAAPLAAAVAAAASAAVTAAAAIPAAVAAAAGALFARPGFVHRQRTAAERLAVELLDGLLGLAAVRHLDEAEAPRVARKLVLGHGCRLDRAVFLESLAEFRIGGRVWQIANVDVHVEPCVVNGIRRPSNEKAFRPSRCSSKHQGSESLRQQPRMH